MKCNSLVATVAVVTATGLVLAGCGGGTSPSGGPVQLELAIVASGDTPTAYEEQIKRFNESQDGIELSLRTFASGEAYNQALTGQVAGGAAPDVFLLDTGQQLREYAEADVILPLDELIESAGVDTSEFDASLVDASTVDGALYAVPKDYSTTALFYRKSLLEQAGVEPPTTWDELRSAAQTLTVDGRWGLGMYPQLNYFLAWIQAAGGNFATADGIENFDNPQHVEAVDFLNTLFTVDKSAASPQMTGASWDGEMLALGQVAMVFGGTWVPGGVPPEEQDDIGVVAFPPLAQPGSVLYAAGWVVAAQSEHPEAAAELIKFLTSDEELVTAHDAGIVLIPPKASALAVLVERGEDPVLAIAQEGASEGVPFGLLTTDQVDQYNAMLADLIANPGTRTPAEAVAGLAADLD